MAVFDPERTAKDFLIKVVAEGSAYNLRSKCADWSYLERLVSPAHCHLPGSLFLPPLLELHEHPMPQLASAEVGRASELRP